MSHLPPCKAIAIFRARFKTDGGINLLEDKLRNCQTCQHTGGARNDLDRSGLLCRNERQGGDVTIVAQVFVQRQPDQLACPGVPG